MKALVVVALLAGSAGIARADYCVGDDCGAGAQGWHEHGCWDMGRKADGTEDYMASGCYQGVIECWDAQDATCEILSEWGGYPIGREECDAAPNKVTPRSVCAQIVQYDLAQEKYKREREAKEQELVAEFGDSVGSQPPVEPPPPPPADASGNVPPPRVAPPRINPWTPQTGVPLKSYGTVTTVDFQQKVPCTICVTFTPDTPKLDVVWARDTVPDHPAAAAALADDANETRAHVDAQVTMPSPLGGAAPAQAAPATTGALGGGYGAPPPADVAANPQDNAAIEQARPALGIKVEAAVSDRLQQEATDRQVNEVAKQNQEDIGKIMSGAADQGQWTSGHATTFHGVAMKIVMAPDRATVEEAWDDARAIVVDEVKGRVNGAIDAVNFIGTRLLGIPWKVPRFD